MSASTLTRLGLAVLTTCALSAGPAHSAEPKAPGAMQLELESTYPVVGCRNAHAEHAEIMREQALGQCRLDGDGTIKWLRYKSVRCRYENKGKAPTRVTGRVTFECMPR